MDSRRILVVDDEETLRHVLRQTLEQHDCEVAVAPSAEAALDLLKTQPFDVALLDIVLPGMSGLDLLRIIKETSASTEVLMMTSHSSTESAIRAIRDGAYDYLRKPFDDIDDIWVGVQRALEKAHLSKRNRALVQALREQNSELADSIQRLTSLLETSRAMREFHSLTDLFEFFVDVVARELDVERLSLMLLDDSTDALVITAHRGLDEVQVEGVRVPLGKGIAGRVAREAKPMLVQRTEDDPRVAGEGKPDLSTSFISAPIVLSVPIISHAQVLGVLNVTNRRSEQPFGPEDLDYVQGMTNQLAVAIESARRFDHLQRAYDSLREAQDQLVASERLKALGQMAAGVAHDFNNALAVILGRSEASLVRLAAGEEVDRDRLRESFESIVKVSLQAAETIKRVQDFTRIRKDTPQSRVELDRVVEEAIEMTRPRWQNEVVSEGREIRVTLDPTGPPPIRGNAHELIQVVNNLIFNAVDAMPAGGEIRFSTRAIGSSARLSVTDQGEGMSEETRERVFEPFYTTKEAGNGLGMSVVYGIVRRHAGEITIRSRPGEGTTFELDFPAEIERPESGDSTGPPVEDLHGVRVLFVDDDEIVRQAILGSLDTLGHRTVAVASGAEALEVFRPGNFDLVITDFNMPGMSGVEVAVKLREAQSDIPVILLSGWARLEEEESVRRAGIGWILSKPCLAEELQRTMHAALKDRTPTPEPPAAPAGGAESGAPTPTTPEMRT